MPTAFYITYTDETNLESLISVVISSLSPMLSQNFSHVAPTVLGAESALDAGSKNLARIPNLPLTR
jgi:hypothetical protein